MREKRRKKIMSPSKVTRQTRPCFGTQNWSQMSCPVLLSLVSLQVLCDPGQGTINLGIGSEELNFKSSRAKGGVNLKSIYFFFPSL